MFPRYIFVTLLQAEEREARERMLAEKQEQQEINAAITLIEEMERQKKSRKISKAGSVASTSSIPLSSLPVPSLPFHTKSREEASTTGKAGDLQAEDLKHRNSSEIPGQKVPPETQSYTEGILSCEQTCDRTIATSSKWNRVFSHLASQGQEPKLVPCLLGGNVLRDRFVRAFLV